MKLHDLQTPALVLDRAKLTANAKRMADKAAHFGVSLRPHLKTAKSIHVARLVKSLGAVGGAVSTLNEADYFLSEGFSDLQYAVCLTPNKFERVRSLIERGARLTVITDDEGVAMAIDSFSRAADVTVHAMLEIDCGEHRTGVAPDDEAVIRIGKILDQAPMIAFEGVMTHGGQAYGHHNVDDIKRIAEEERSAVTRAAHRLREAGVTVAQVSLGSSPTVTHGESFDGVSEIRPGVYLFGDLAQSEMKTCSVDDIAVSVLSTVISRHEDKGRTVIDAGGLALSKDRSTAKYPRDYGYGLVRSMTGQAVPGDPIVQDVHQEHGEIALGPDAEMPHVGGRVRILPNHICMTAAMYDRYYVVEGGEEIVDIWPRTNGW